MEDRLQKFTALVDEENFTRAAERLHMSQPALTLAVRKLERELKAELLVRVGHGFRLTSAGRLAYIEGKELLTRRENLKLQLAQLQNQKVPLAIGMIDSVAEALLDSTDIFDTLDRIAEISLSINNSAALAHATVRGQLDLAIMARKPSPFSSRLVATELGVEPLIFVAHKNQSREVANQLEQGVLSHFLSYNQTSTTHQLIQDRAMQAGLELRPAFYSTSPQIILRQVCRQKGAAALPQLLVRELIQSGELVPFCVGQSCIVERHIVAVHQAGRMVHPAVSALLGQTTNTLRQLHTEAAQY